MELDLENDDGSDDLNPAGSDSELEEFTIEDSPAEKNEELEEVLDMSEMASANEDRAKEGSRQTKALKQLEFVKKNYSARSRANKGEIKKAANNRTKNNRMQDIFRRLDALEKDFNGEYILLAASPNNAVWSCLVRSFGKIVRTYHQSRTGVALTNQWLKVFDDKQKERISSEKDPSNSSHPSRNLSPEGQEFPSNVTSSPSSTTPSDSSPTSPPQRAPNPGLHPDLGLQKDPSNSSHPSRNRSPEGQDVSKFPSNVNSSLSSTMPSDSSPTSPPQRAPNPDLTTSMIQAPNRQALSKSNRLPSQLKKSSLPTSITNAIPSNELSTQAPSKSLVAQKPLKPNQILLNPAQALPKVKGVIVKTSKGMFLKMSDSQVLVPITGLQRPK